MSHPSASVAAYRPSPPDTALSAPRSRRPAPLLPPRALRSRHQAVDLEDFRVLTVDVDPVRARDVPDVLAIGVAPVLLGGVPLQRVDLPLEVRLLERHVRLVFEVEVVPRDLVAEEQLRLQIP